MKLAEALARRADLKTRITELRERLKQSGQVQEGEKPPEDPQVLMAQLVEVLKERDVLVARIAVTNATATISGKPGADTLALVIAMRDSGKEYHRALAELASEAAAKPNRYSVAEIKLVSTVDVKDIRSLMDSVAGRTRLLDLALQKRNWEVDLLDGVGSSAGGVE